MFQFLNLRSSESGLHVGGLQVVADVRIGVLVIVSAWEGAQLPGKSFAAGIVFSRVAPAIASPVTKRFDQHLQIGLVGEHCPALTHRDVVGGIETARGDIAEGAYATPLPGRSKRVATVLNQPQIVFADKGHHRIEVEDIPQGMCNHDGPGLIAAGGLELRHIDFVSWEGNIHEDRHQAVLDDWIDGGRKSGGHRDHLVSGLQSVGHRV